MEKVSGSGELDAVQRFARRSRIMGARRHHFEGVKVWYNRKISGEGFEYRFCQITH